MSLGDIYPADWAEFEREHRSAFFWLLHRSLANEYRRLRDSSKRTRLGAKAL